MPDDPREPTAGTAHDVNGEQVVKLELTLFSEDELAAMATEVAEDEEATKKAVAEAGRNRTFLGLTTSL